MPQTRKTRKARKAQNSRRRQARAEKPYRILLKDNTTREVPVRDWAKWTCRYQPLRKPRLLGAAQTRTGAVTTWFSGCAGVLWRLSATYQIGGQKRRIQTLWDTYEAAREAHISAENTIEATEDQK